MITTPRQRPGPPPTPKHQTMKYAGECTEAAVNAILSREKMKPVFEQISNAATKGERSVVITGLEYDEQIALVHRGFEVFPNHGGDTNTEVRWLHHEF